MKEIIARRTRRVCKDGERFTRWTVLAESTVRIKNSPTYLCECDCGTKREVVGNSLRSGRSKSCGCLSPAKIRDAAESRRKSALNDYTHHLWQEMWRVGTRPIAPEWRSYDRFWRDIGARPRGLALVLVSEYRGYERDNVAWKRTGTFFPKLAQRSFRRIAKLIAAGYSDTLISEKLHASPSVARSVRRAVGAQRRPSPWFRRHPITREQVLELYRAQGRACGICKEPKRLKDLAVDHCHEFGYVRGLLCRLCNAGLGCFRDVEANLLAGRAWLRAARARHASGKTAA